MTRSNKKTLAWGFACLAWLGFSGCTANFDPPPLRADHPASVKAEEAERRPRLASLGVDALTRKTKAQLARREAPNPDFTGDAMSHGGHDMGGMKMSTAAAQPSTSTDSRPYWTCVMHPEIHAKEPGECPKCGMTLVKKEGVAK